jgi:hypothetical protein
MSRITLALLIVSLLVLSICPAFVVAQPVEDIVFKGNISITDGGQIIFPDGSSQSTATVQGAKGDKGDPGSALASIDALKDSPCTSGTSIPGKLDVAYDASGSISLKCIYTTFQLSLQETSQSTYQCNPHNCNAYSCNPYSCNAYSCNPYSCNPYSCGTFGQSTCWNTCYQTCYQTCYNTCYQTCYDSCPASLSVTSNPSGINCSTTGTNTCTYVFRAGTVVTLTGDGATAFSGNCSGIGNCAVLMDGPKSVSATK